MEKYMAVVVEGEYLRDEGGKYFITRNGKKKSKRTDGVAFELIATRRMMRRKRGNTQVSSRMVDGNKEKKVKAIYKIKYKLFTTERNGVVNGRKNQKETRERGKSEKG